MTEQEIEKLKYLCEKEGFELDFISKSTQGAMDIFRVTKKQEEVRVLVKQCSRLHDVDSSESDFDIKFKIFGQKERINPSIVADHLAKCLEDYLNKS